MKYAILVLAVLCLALPDAVLAQGYEVADLHVAQAGTSAVSTVYTNLTPRQGDLAAVDVQLSGYAAPTCTVTLATDGAVMAPQTVFSEIFTASRMVYPAVPMTTNGVAIGAKERALFGSKLILTATAGNSTGIVVRAQALIRPVR